MLKFYNVKDEYINYLRQFDQRIYENRQKRPYIGVVCEVDEIDIEKEPDVKYKNLHC